MVAARRLENMSRGLPLHQRANCSHQKRRTEETGEQSKAHHIIAIAVRDIDPAGKSDQIGSNISCGVA